MAVPSQDPVHVPKRHPSCAEVGHGERRTASWRKLPHTGSPPYQAAAPATAAHFQHARYLALLPITRVVPDLAFFQLRGTDRNQTDSHQLIRKCLTESCHLLLICAG